MKRFFGRLFHLWVYGFALSFVGALGIVAFLVGNPMEWLYFFTHPGDPAKEEVEMKASLRVATILALLFWACILAAYPPSGYGWAYVAAGTVGGVASWYLIERRYVSLYHYMGLKDGR